MPADLTPGAIDALVKRLRDKIADAEADYADDMEQGRYTGERPDLCEYGIILDLTEARQAADTIAALEAERDSLAQRLKLTLDQLDTAFARMHSGMATIAALEARVEALTGVLQWYGEQARLCRLIHSEGDAGRRALQADGGNRARAALSQKDTPDA